ncbi:Predicted spermidine synthase with an N-terminal membrane domain [Loktanella fryxellensis]|uniref:Predicted spermidine synthase with an N-terminal membrane domain n=1 Tax=Loktanella fryxellensis TaxID=245187 RepID=A0A1H8B3L3_9RHOB|nr:fused MFS/spermidine synthase [Loktanella fryxellensis]SEM77512.1 Predicted spermidine synthase with an N-terminal membrane domain [Loktanella fryxellensis]
MPFWTTIGLILLLSTLGLTYEIAAGRVLAPYFGTSLLTWTAVIATILTGFSLGSALGGFIAERPRPAAAAAVRRALIATAVLMALSPQVLGVIYAVGLRGTGGMLLAVLVAFFPASVLVSLPSPFLARIAVEARPGREGSSLGLVLSAGSLGAIGGAIVAGFVALPVFGAVATFAACGAAALLCVPFVRGGPAGPGGPPAPAGAAVPVIVAGLVVAASLTGGPICRYESGMSCIDVVRQGGAVNLYSDRTQQAAERTGQGTSDASDPLILPYTQWIWARMEHDLGPAPNVLFVGGGGYTLPTQLLAARPMARALAVEIDPLITQVVRAQMPWASAMIARTGYDAAAGGTAGAARLGIVHADGRVFLNETDQRFDAAVMDAFSSGSVPAHLVTQETYARLRQIVDGPVYVNLIDRPDGPLVRGMHAILRGIYPHVEVVQGPPSSRGRANLLLAASPAPLTALASLPDGYARVAVGDARPFTDDRGWVGHR